MHDLQAKLWTQPLSRKKFLPAKMLTVADDGDVIEVSNSVLRVRARERTQLTMWKKREQNAKMPKRLTEEKESLKKNLFWRKDKRRGHTGTSLKCVERQCGCKGSMNAEAVWRASKRWTMHTQSDNKSKTVVATRTVVEKWSYSKLLQVTQSQQQPDNTVVVTLNVSKV